VAVSTYTNPPFPCFNFCYLCDTPDNGGQWNNFTPNGTNDHHWQLRFTLDANTTIKRLEVYQLDSDGLWTTGAAWATDSPIIPPGQSDDFAVFPLLVFEAAVQQWAAYQSSLGTFGAASYTWDLYGDINVAASGQFRLDFILDDDTRVSQVDAVCVGSCSACCSPPATPTVTGKCDGAVDVEFSGTVGRPYRIFKSSSVCESGAWEEVDSGTIASTPQTVEVSGLVQGCLYSFYVSIDEAGCGYRDSDPASAVASKSASVSVSIDKTSVVAGESFTVSWSSSNLGGATCGGCADGEISTPFGCKPGNTSGSQSTSVGSCGTANYEVVGCNACGTVVASQAIEVRCTCTTCNPATIPNKITFQNPTSFLRGFFTAGLPRCTPGALYFDAPWNGELFKASGVCRYGDLTTAKFGGDNSSSGVHPALFVQNAFNAVTNKWVITILGDSNSGSPTYWIGEKTGGCDPTGVYAKTGGCCTGPATITVT
jgi:hypothetical protein